MTHRAAHTLRILFLLVAVGPAGCGSTGEKSVLLGDSQVTVVGRIELVPALDENELKSIGAGLVKNRGYVILSDRFIETDKFQVSAGSHGVLVDLGKHFVVKRKQFDNLRFSGIWIGNKVAHYNEQIRLPSKAIYRLRPDDKAVYIGTLRYYRDEYNGIKKVEYIDEYNDALKEFYKAQGNTKTLLRKVAPEPPK